MIAAPFFLTVAAAILGASLATESHGIGTVTIKEGEGLKMRKALGMLAKDDPLPHIVAHGFGTIDVHLPELGNVRGLRSRLVDKFLGLPYSIPPIGPRRWAKAELLTSWKSFNLSKTDTSEAEGPLDATRFGSACLSQEVDISVIREENESEDCLFLNVFTPKGHLDNPDAPLLPVLVFIPGGAFILGSSSNPSVSPPPDKLVSSGQLIYVSVNYRLGAMGFITSSALDGFGGANGILDQQVALKWVQRFIYLFGGDASRVTAMGESAGAISLCLHLVAESSRGLFSKAIIQSGLCNFPFENVRLGQKTTNEIARRLGCLHDPDSPEIKMALRNSSFAKERGFTAALQRARVFRPDLESGVCEADVIFPSSSSSFPSDRKKAGEGSKGALERFRDALVLAYHDIVNARTGDQSQGKPRSELSVPPPSMDLTNFQQLHEEEEEEEEETEPVVLPLPRRRDRLLEGAKTIALWPLRWLQAGPSKGHRQLAGPGNLLAPTQAGAAFLKGRLWRSWMSWLFAQEVNTPCGGNETLVGECGNGETSIHSSTSAASIAPDASVASDTSIAKDRPEAIDNEIAALKAALKVDVSTAAGSAWGKSQLFLQEALSKLTRLTHKGEQKAVAGRVSPFAEVGALPFPGDGSQGPAFSGERKEMQEEEEKMEAEEDSASWRAGFGRFQQEFYRPPVLRTEERLADELTMACLREKNGSAIKAAVSPRRGFLFYQGFSFFPVISGTASDLFDHPLHLIRRGNWWAKEEGVEIVVGANKDEASAFLLVWPFLFSEHLVRDFLESTVGAEHAAKLWAAYIDPGQFFLRAINETVEKTKSWEPDHVDGISTWSGRSILIEQAASKRKEHDPSLIISLKVPDPANPSASSSSSSSSSSVPPLSPLQISLRDRTLVALNDLWTCATHNFADTLADHGGKVRLYHFGHEPTYSSRLMKWLRSYHGAELDFLSGFLQTAGAPPTDEEIHLSAETARIWIEIVTGRRKALVQDSSLPPGKSYLITDEDPASPGGGYAALGAREGLPPAGFGGSLEKLHVERDWPYYDSKEQRCLHLKTGPRVDRCNLFTCELWEATMTAGLMPIPPQSPEPFMSLLLNRYGALFVNGLINRARYVLPLLALLFVAVAFPLVRACLRLARRAWLASADLRSVWRAITWASTHGYAQSLYSS